MEAALAGPGLVSVSLVEAPAGTVRMFLAALAVNSLPSVLRCLEAECQES